MTLEKKHHRGGHGFPAVFDEREGPLVPQDPINVIPTEPVLSEAKDFESIQPVKVIGPGNTEQGAVKPRTRLLSFSTPVRATKAAFACGRSVARARAVDLHRDAVVHRGCVLPGPRYCASVI